MPSLGEKPSSQQQEPQEPQPDRTRLKILAGVGFTLAMPTAAGVLVSFVNNQWERQLRDKDEQLEALRREVLRQMDSEKKSYEYGKGTVVVGNELLFNGNFDEKAIWDKTGEKRRIPGWTQLPDEDIARTPSWAGPHSGGRNYIAIRNDSQNPASQENFHWQSDPVKIDPDKPYIVAFSTIRFKDEFVASDSANPTLSLLFLNSKGEVIEEQRAYLQMLAPSDSDILRRVITRIGEGQKDVSPTIPSQAVALQLKFGTNDEKDSRFRVSETRFGEISVRELGIEPKPISPPQTQIGPIF